MNESELKLERKRMELKRCEMARLELEFKIKEILCDVDRLKGLIELQNKREQEINNELKGNLSV